MRLPLGLWHLVETYEYRRMHSASTYPPKLQHPGACSQLEVMSNNPLDNTTTVPQWSSGISNLLTYFGLAVKLPLAFIQWSYRGAASTNPQSCSEGSCSNQQGAVLSPLNPDSCTVPSKDPNPTYTNYFPRRLYLLSFEQLQEFFIGFLQADTNFFNQF